MKKIAICVVYIQNSKFSNNRQQQATT